MSQDEVEDGALLLLADGQPGHFLKLCLQIVAHLVVVVVDPEGGDADTVQSESLEDDKGLLWEVAYLFGQVVDHRVEDY